MAKIPSEFAPTLVDKDILALCQQLVPESKPVLVPIAPWSKARLQECYDNVEKYIAEYGGQKLLGWRLMRWANIMIEAEAHAIWCSPEGELIDITPYEQSKSLFLPDPKLEYTGHPIPNQRRPLTNSPLIAEYINLLNQFDMLSGEVQAWESFGIPREILERIHEIGVLLKAKVERNELCPCQSGLKFKKCCGRF